MPNSPLHLILNDIRVKYSGKECSIIDIRQIENQYKICSILNSRSDGVAFLRITCFGLKQVVFEDICLNMNSVLRDEKDSHNYIFALNKALYESAYGVNLIDDNKRHINEYVYPSIDFYSMEEEMKTLKEKCLALEKKIEKLTEDCNQQTLF